MSTDDGGEPLSRLEAGAEALVTRMACRDAGRLMRFATLGVAPGARVRVEQTSPAIVLRVGRTTLACERCLADEIYVKRVR